MVCICLVCTGIGFFFRWFGRRWGVLCHIPCYFSRNFSLAESSPHLIEILPKLAEVVKALGLQPGVLENTNIYTLPTSNETQDVSELVRSLSAYPMIIRLLEILWNQRLREIIPSKITSTKEYRQNSGLDLNKDGKVTKLKAASLVRSKIEATPSRASLVGSKIEVTPRSMSGLRILRL